MSVFVTRPVLVSGENNRLSVGPGVLSGDMYKGGHMYVHYNIAGVSFT